ncbi:MAG: hypothetical protein JNM84_21295 [Planctomycetes bacterium]|nr:hypothetical protein [Planctomycetota bacterium]
MNALRPLRRSALRCALTAIAVCGAMLGILAAEGRLSYLREQLFGASARGEAELSRAPGTAVALPHLAASTAFFSVPAPCDAQALASLERELQSLQSSQRERLRELESRACDLAEREAHCAAEEARLARAKEELQRLAERMELRAAEIEREMGRYEAATEAADRRAARALSEMEPAAAAAMLSAGSDPTEAARVFAQLPADQQASIANAFDEEQRARFWPAWLRVERARAMANGRKTR